jgi:dihydroxy-acid dehydratase
VIRELSRQGLLHDDAPTVNGKTLAENNRDAQCFRADVVRGFDAPFKRDAGIAVLRGNLAPDGAIIKPSAASPHLMQHTGRAVVFESIEDLHARINDDALDIDEHSVMVLKYCGPKGYPGMAEVGNMPLPAQAAEARHHRHRAHFRCPNVRHGVRDRRAARGAGGRGGRAARAGAERRRHHARRRGPQPASGRGRCGTRRAARRSGRRPPRTAARGYVKLYVDHVLQANEGADLDFLVGRSGSAVPRDNH